MTMPRFRLTLLALLTAAACDSGDTASDKTNGGGGKADDSSEGEGPYCSPNVDSGFGTRVADLQPFVTESFEFTAQDVHEMTDVETQQLLDSLLYLGKISSDANVDEAFRVLDGGVLKISTIDSDEGFVGTAHLYKIKGVDHGAIFEYETTDIYALIEAGAILGCEREEPSLEPVAVTCDPESPFVGGNPEDLQDAITGTAMFTPAELTSLTPILSTQLLEAAVHHGLARRDQNLQTVFAGIDRNEMIRHTLELEIAHGLSRLDWVEFSVNNTGYGVLFWKDSAEVMAAGTAGKLFNCFPK